VKAKPALAMPAGAVTTLTALASHVDVLDGALNNLAGPHVVFHGVNVHVQNGAGVTQSQNSLGNLIIGYDEGYFPGGDSTKPLIGVPANRRSGSHSLILGFGHAWTGHSDIVAGYHNSVISGRSAILGGRDNTITAEPGSAGWSAENVILGGDSNHIAGAWSNVVSGGSFNRIEKNAGQQNSISGGRDSHITGGHWNSITGGALGTIDTIGGSITCGWANTVSSDPAIAGRTGVFSTIGGGYGGWQSVVAGWGIGQNGIDHQLP
jgi:hypothetical protein